jgi:hypothetical protein
MDELAALLRERGLAPLGSCPAFLGGISQLTWSRVAAEAPAPPPATASDRLPELARTASPG